MNRIHKQVIARRRAKGPQRKVQRLQHAESLEAPSNRKWNASAKDANRTNATKLQLKAITLNDGDQACES